MATTLKLNRRYETIQVMDDDGEVALSWRLAMDDRSVESRLRMVGSAMDRFAAVQGRIDAAETEEEAREAVKSMVKLLRRTITAVIGEEGWNDVLRYIGDGEPVDPAEHVMAIGEVFAALVNWLYERCTNRQLRELNAKLQQGGRGEGKPAAGKRRPNSAKKGGGK